LIIVPTATSVRIGNQRTCVRGTAPTLTVVAASG
jgi:hypothetical protein